MKTDIDNVNRILDKIKIPICNLCGKPSPVTLCDECAALRDAGQFGKLFVRACAETLRRFKAILKRRREFGGLVEKPSAIEWGEPVQWKPRRRFELASERRRKRDALLFWRCYGVGMTLVALFFLWLAIHRGS